NWGPVEEDDLSMHEWTLRLSRGEYQEDLYWECIAEEREERGEWNAAIDAYRKILDLSDASYFELCKAHVSIGTLQALLWQDAAALASFRAVSSICTANDSSLILWRFYVRHEISQLLRTGHTRRARKLIDCALVANFDEEVVNYLTMADL